MRLSPQRFVNALYTWMVNHVEDADRFEHLLWLPPAGLPPTPERIADEMADFDAFAAAFGAKRPVASPPKEEVPSNV